MITPDAENDVLLSYVHNGSVAHCFMDSVLAAFVEDARQSKRRLTEFHPVGGPYIHDNRARAARYFLENTDKQWMWFLDNDMDFPMDTLQRMLEYAEEHDCRVLGAAYWNQYGTSGTYLSWLLMTPDAGVRAMGEIPDQEDPVPVAAVGMGCTLIHRSVLQDVADMYPNDPWDTFAADMLVRFDDGRMMIARTPDDFDQETLAAGDVVEYYRMGEDVTFCLRAAKAGYQVYGMPTLVVDHYKPHFVVHGLPEMSPVG